MAKRREIRNSTAEFLIFQIEGKEQGIEVYYKDKTVWCTQKAMGMLFDCSSDNVGLHLKNIFASGELVKDSVTEKISATAGSVTAEEAKEHAETEFEKYRIVQDRLFQSDFDKFLGELPFDGE